MTAVAGITALVGAVKSLTGAMQGAIANYAHFESMQKGLETFFQDADKGKAKFEELRKMSNETTFGVDELANSFTQLANVGVDVDTIRDKLMMLGDVSQGNKQVFAELVSIYSKINATGKASSVAIQQLALRGLPIYDMLKKIGVQGTATADDITKALQEMTKEGGQFHDAMNNINDTIEGKEGFVSDYFKEMTVNLAEVTGLADAYKASLDILREAIGGISDSLLSANDNPLMKAILSGAMTTILGGLVTVIGVGLVGALKTVIVQLGIAKALVAAFSVSNPIGWIGLGVGALAGLTAGIVSFVKSQKEAREETEKHNEALREQLKLANEGGKPTSRNDRLATQLGILKDYEEIRDNTSKQLEELTNKKQEYEEVISSYLSLDRKRSSKYSLTEYQEAKGQIEKITEEVEQYTQGLEKANKLVADQEILVNHIKDDIAKFSNLDELVDSFDKIHSKIKGSNVELENLLDQLATVQTYKGMEGQQDNNGNIIRFDESTRKAIDDTVKYLQEKIKKIKLDISFEKTDDWRKQIQNILKLDKKDVLFGNGKDIVDTYISNRQKQMQAFLNKNTIASELGLNTSDISKQILAFAQDSFKQINALLDTGNFSATDNSIVALRNNIEVLRTQFINMKGSAEDFDKALGSVIDTTKNFSLGDDIKNSVLSGISKTDVGDFVENLRNGGTVIGSFISVLVKDLISLVGGMDKVQYILNIIKNLLDALSPLLEAIVNIVAILGVILKPILTLLKNFLNFIFKDFNDSMDELYNSIQDETKARKSSTKSLVESYKKLGEAIKEQQEYYLKRKQELNADTYKEGVVRKVNDMILTDKGVFSTSPQDTIMAMKKPESLLGAGKTNINVKVIDNVGVNTNVRQEGNNLLIELLSQKVAVDYSDGSNGWGGAVQRQHQTSGGRSLSL